MDKTRMRAQRSRTLRTLSTIAILLVAPTGVRAQSEFKPGEVWHDTEGKPIQAHGGGILLHDGVYYWYGEDKTLGNGNKTGVSCYWSKDLYQWKHEGVVLPKDGMPPEFRDNGIVERPKVLYNAKTKKYVMWMHLDDQAYRVASAGIATSDRPAGPFTFVKQIRPIRDDFNYKAGAPDQQKERGGTFRDMNLFLDDDGQGYVFYASEGNATMYIVRLDEEFLGPQMPTEHGKTWARVFVKKSREAPAPFKYNGKYYVITSDCSGWFPNPADYAVADNILGPWQMKGNPCVGANANTTFRSQSTCVLPVANKPGCFIFMADRWNPNKLQDSRYVWLPLRMTDNGTFTLKWIDKWDLSVLDATAEQPVRAETAQGMYFAKKQYLPQPLPQFAATKDKLPSPIYDENPLYVAMYWKTWELAFRNFYEPKPGSGFVSQFIDAAFNDNIFLWDTCFLTMFCNYGHPLVPGIASLDNFYAKQYENGEICREINRTTGRDYIEWVNREQKDLFSRWSKFSVLYTGREVPQPRPHLTLDALNHPIFAWAELESVRVTGDRSRLKIVYEPLVHYYRALQNYIRQGNGLYMTDWASMDNAPRNPYLDKGGTAVDTSAQMVLFANQLAEIADLLEKQDAAAAFRKEAEDLKRIINAKMWDANRKFYFDLTVEGKQAPAKTIAAYWTLLAGVASSEQADALAAELRNPASFGRKHRVPTTPADQAGYDPAGGYWRGAVWAPTTTMVVRGLERYGKHDLAREIAAEHLRTVGEVFQKTGTVWENYAPDSAAPGRPAKGDFVGWTGIVPILYFFEYGIGLKPDAPGNRLTWTLTSDKRCGCGRFRFNAHTATLIAEPEGTQPGKMQVTVDSDGAFELRIHRHGKQYDFAVKAGKNSFTVE